MLAWNFKVLKITGLSFDAPSLENPANIRINLATCLPDLFYAIAFERHSLRRCDNRI